MARQTHEEKSYNKFLKSYGGRNKSYKKQFFQKLLIEKNANIFDQTLSKHLKILDFDIFKTFSTNYFLHAFGVRGLGILPKIK